LQQKRRRSFSSHQDHWAPEVAAAAAALLDAPGGGSASSAPCQLQLVSENRSRHLGMRSRRGQSARGLNTASAPSSLPPNQATALARLAADWAQLAAALTWPPASKLKFEGPSICAAPTSRQNRAKVCK